jgi:tocopherol cyclase
VIQGSAGLSSYHRFTPEAFRSRRDRFQVEVGENLFSLERVRLRLEGFEAELQTSERVRWPSCLFAPSSMGWYSLVRFMECYHGVIVLDALAEGRVNGRSRSAGRFYLEKDWGSSFPKAWIWMQSNYFGGRPASLTCSVARVPFRGREFTGFIAGLLAGGVLYRFATYNGARLEQASASAGAAEVALRHGSLSLRLRATRRAGVELASPVNGEMSGRIVESLRSEVEVRLSRAGRTLFEGTGTCAGLEVVRPEELARAEVRLPA